MTEFCAYMLRCADGSYYIDHTDNLTMRVAQHNVALGSKWTRTRLPVELAWSQDFSSRDEAFAVERQIKGWRREKKEALIAGAFHLLPELAKTAQTRPSTGSGRAEAGAEQDAPGPVRSPVAHARPSTGSGRAEVGSGRVEAGSGRAEVGSGRAVGARSSDAAFPLVLSLSKGERSRRVP